MILHVLIAMVAGRSNSTSNTLSPICTRKIVSSKPTWGAADCG